MKALFVPHPMLSHVIPLIALARRVASHPDIECAFLLPRQLHGFARAFGMRVLEIDRRLNDGLKPEMLALSELHPDVVIDDLSPTTAHFVKMVGLPRISVVRKGVLPGDTSVSKQQHSSGINLLFSTVRAMNLREHGIWEPKQLTDFFVGDLNLIPSCAEIEALPTHLRDTGAYQYTGPLLLEDDELMDNWGHIIGDHAMKGDARASLDKFLARNVDRKIIYHTVGLANPEALFARRAVLVQTMLDSGAAVVSNVPMSSLRPEDRSRFFCAHVLPMNKVCSSVDLMVHHCGSGAYAYQVAHRCPAVILGTRSADRDPVGARLAELGAARYWPVQELDDSFGLEELRENLQELMDRDSDARHAQLRALGELRESLMLARERFDFADALYSVVSRHERLRSNA